MQPLCSARLRSLAADLWKLPCREAYFCCRFPSRATTVLGATKYCVHMYTTQHPDCRRWWFINMVEAYPRIPFNENQCTGRNARLLSSQGVQPFRMSTVCFVCSTDSLSFLSQCSLGLLRFPTLYAFMGMKKTDGGRSPFEDDNVSCVWEEKALHA